MMQADRHGFLVGSPISTGAADTLAAIKRDTGGILALLRRAGSEVRTAAPTRRIAREVVRAINAASTGRADARRRSGQTAPQAMPAQGWAGRSTATPAGRAWQARERDALGRFVAATSRGRSSTDARASAAADQSAKATEVVAKTVAADRRDRKVAEGLQKRGADGRFGSGGKGGGKGGGWGGFGGGGPGVAAATIEAGERLDPLIDSAREVKGLVQSVRDIAAPAARMAVAAWRAPKRMIGAAGSAIAWARQRSDIARAVSDSISKAISRRGAAQDGGGLLSMLPMLGSLVAPLSAAAGGITAAVGAMLGGAGKAFLRKIPMLGALVATAEAVIEDGEIAGDQSLSEAERRRRRAENAGGAGGALAGAAAGAAAGSLVMPGVGTAAGAVLGGIAGSKIGKTALGWLSAQFESGSAGAGAVSSGRGDAGGASYGTHQLSSKAGTLQQFLAASGYGAQFAGMQPGSPEFNAQWKRMAADPAFGKAQSDFIASTHYAPQMQKLGRAGIDLAGRGSAVHEAVYSTAVQFGGNSSVVQKALAGRDVASMSDADIVSAIQDYKIANNATLFKSSSPAVQASTLARAGRERDALVAMAAAPSSASSVSAPMVASSSYPTEAPKVDPVPTRLSSPVATVAQAGPVAPPRQDVGDRAIAHIVTGGIGGVYALR